RHAQRRALRFPVVDALLGRGAERRNSADVAYLAQVVDEVVRARRDSGDTRADDLLGLMLNAPHPDTGEPLDEVNIRNQVITFLVAGHETTSGALSFALYYLSRHPDVLARARAEVDAVWGDDPAPAFEHVAKLRHVRRVLDESLRLWPTAPAFAREARRDTVLGGRYPMRAGDWVFVLIPLLHGDPVWGADVETFDPDRFHAGAGQGPAGARVQAVRYRRAGLHRPPVRPARGDPGARHAPAPLQPGRRPRLPPPRPGTAHPQAR